MIRTEPGYDQPPHTASAQEQSIGEPTTDFKFVFCEHSVENSDRIAEQLGDRDIIAFETVVETEELRQNMSETLTMYVADTTDDETRRDIEEWATENNDDGWDVAVLKHFIGTNKKVALIDVNKDQPAHETVDAWHESQDNLATALIRGAGIPELKEKLIQEVDASAHMVATRDEVDATQLDALAIANPGARIGAVLGSMHTGVQHAISKKYDTSRTFIASGDTTAAPKHQYNHYHEAARNIRFGVGKAIGAGVLNRLLLERMAAMYDGQELSRESLDSLGDETVEAALSGMDRSKSS